MRAALDPRTDAPSLTPLGAAVMSGYGRRPKWLCPNTLVVVAANVWRAKGAERLANPGCVLVSRGGRFAENWKVDYMGFLAMDLWRAESQKRMDRAIGEAKRRRIERLGNPKTRCKTDQVCDNCWVRHATLTDEQSTQRLQLTKQGKQIDLTL